MDDLFCPYCGCKVDVKTSQQADIALSDAQDDEIKTNGMFCFNCGAKNNVGDRFCLSCGSNLNANNIPVKQVVGDECSVKEQIHHLEEANDIPKQIICQECGEANGREDVFCLKCGAKLSAEEEGTASNGRDSISNANKTGNRFCIKAEFDKRCKEKESAKAIPSISERITSDEDCITDRITRNPINEDLADDTDLFFDEEVSFSDRMNEQEERHDSKKNEGPYTYKEEAKPQEKSSSVYRPLLLVVLISICIVAVALVIDMPIVKKAFEKDFKKEDTSIAIEAEEQPTATTVAIDEDVTVKIKKIQAKLMIIGILTEAEDGKADNNTVEAVRTFQRWVNQLRGEETLVVSGQCDELTMAYLDYCVENDFTYTVPTEAPTAPVVLQTKVATMEPTATPSPRPTATPTVKPTTVPNKYSVLQKGDKGNAVERLQERLLYYNYFDGNVDGDFGNITCDAVKMFQRYNGLQVTGSADNTTQCLLFDGTPKQYILPSSDMSMYKSWSSFGGSEITVTGSSQSSYLTDKYYSYKAGYVLDDDNRHCWAADGERTDDVGEWLALSLPGKRIIGGFSIKNGYQLDEKRYYNNYRVKALDVYADNKYLGEARLEDGMGTQYIKFSEPILARTLHFEIVSVYDTNGDTDTCITSMRILSGN